MLNTIKKIYCGNCGKIGHIYKQCNEPITSLGILLYRQINSKREYLLIMRKDSLGYVELIRGNYPLDDLEYLHNIFDEMTITEKKNILNLTFNELWNLLWIEDNYKKVKYQKEYENSHKKFNKLTEGLHLNGKIIDIKYLVNYSKTNWLVPEWGFPKGRRNLKEKNLDCAIREFEEETDIPGKDIYVLKCIEPLEEEFIGSNKKYYKHIYYIAKMMNDTYLPKINKSKKLQVIEIGDIKWLSLTDSLKKIRSYNREKKNILREADCIIDNLESMQIDIS